MEKTRANVTMNVNTWRETKSVAESMGMSASAYVSFCVTMCNRSMGNMMSMIATMTPEELVKYKEIFGGLE